MNTSTLFKKAHALTKKIIKVGDNYRVTFGACIRFILDNLNVETVTTKVSYADVNDICNQLIEKLESKSKQIKCSRDRNKTKNLRWLNKEINFLNDIKHKDVLTIKQADWLKKIAAASHITIREEIKTKKSKVKKVTKVTVCNCDMCVAERNGSESAGYFGLACSKWS